jgi:hypothetical protein
MTVLRIEGADVRGAAESRRTRIVRRMILATPLIIALVALALFLHAFAVQQP